jgi:hypothetical protein
MAHPKNKVNIVESLNERGRRLDRDNPIIATRYYVVEVTPGYTEWGYDGRDIPEKRVIVSPYFSDKQDALDWFSEHEPEEGNRLEIVRQYKRRTVIERWW